MIEFLNVVFGQVEDLDHTIILFWINPNGYILQIGIAQVQNLISLFTLSLAQPLISLSLQCLFPIVGIREFGALEDSKEDGDSHNQEDDPCNDGKAHVLLFLIRIILCIHKK